MFLGLAEGLPGLGEFALFEMEVGEGYFDFGEAWVVLMREGECGEVGLLGLLELAAGAVQMALIEVRRDLGVVVCRLSDTGLVVAAVGELVAAVRDVFHTEVEPRGGEGGLEMSGAAVMVDSLRMVA